MGLKTITSGEALKALADELGLRKDWHEPDEQGITVEIRGQTFDNAGFWGLLEEAINLHNIGNDKTIGRLHTTEMYVVILKNGVPVAEVNLAELFSWACGYKEHEEEE